MTTRTTVSTRLTVADLIERLGDIPAERIWLDPAPGTATEKDVLAAHDRENRLCELVDGVLVEKAMGYKEAVIAGVLIHLIHTFLDEHDLGVVAAPDGMMKLAVGLVRIPDVSFVSWEKLPGRVLPKAPIPALGPDIAVEVLSEGNTPAEMRRKTREYFAAGARLVWLIDPTARIVDVCTSPTRSRRLGEEDVVDGGKVLPGFSFTLRAMLDRARLTR
ncbi:MAG: Uma2 family endonuclease [Planctomycetota bacterium]